MTLDDFKNTLSASLPPAAVAPALVALWHDARGDWQAAHGVAQNVKDDTGSWVHAYLHRKEGSVERRVLVRAGAAAGRVGPARIRVGSDRRRTAGARAASPCTV